MLLSIVEALQKACYLSMRFANQKSTNAPCMLLNIVHNLHIGLIGAIIFDDNSIYLQYPHCPNYEDLGFSFLSSCTMSARAFGAISAETGFSWAFGLEILSAFEVEGLNGATEGSSTEGLDDGICGATDGSSTEGCIEPSPCDSGGTSSADASTPSSSSSSSSAP
jgi:hypothetical protein